MREILAFGVVAGLSIALTIRSLWNVRYGSGKDSPRYTAVDADREAREVGVHPLTHRAPRDRMLSGWYPRIVPPVPSGDIAGREVQKRRFAVRAAGLRVDGEYNAVSGDPSSGPIAPPCCAGSCGQR